MAHLLGTWTVEREVKRPLSREELEVKLRFEKVRWSPKVAPLEVARVYCAPIYYKKIYYSSDMHPDTSRGWK